MDRAPGSGALIRPAGAPIRRDGLPLIPDGLDATLVLVRHGESQYIVEGRFQGQADSPLSPEGRRQVELVARRLAHPLAAPVLPIPDGAPLELAHSPLTRATGTAEAIVAAAPMPIIRRPDADFLEIAQGEWEGLHRDDIQARHGETLAAWRRTPTLAWAPGGESLAEVQARVRAGLGTLLSRLAAAGTPGTRDRDQVAGYGTPEVASHPWSLLVGHDGVFKVTLLTLFDLPLERFWMWSMELCAISVIEFRGGQPVLRAHNLTGHLSTLLDETAQADHDERSRSGAL